MTTCRRCGSENASDSASCYACGGLLATPVGAELAGPPSTYTPPHLADRILASRQALVGERKQVTVLFCDVCDSTALAEELGPEAMHALMSDLFATALEGVHRYEGTVNQFLGDGFMAIFGAPLAHQDHAVRAGLAALAIRDAIAVKSAAPPLPGWERVRARMGLNSGPVVVGGIGNDLRMDYTAVGDTTNVAARLETAAAPGEILMSDAVARAVGSRLRADELEPLTVKGKDDPIRAHRLLDEALVTMPGPLRRSRFVGRAAELEVLSQAFARAAGGGGALVDIEGEPGVGKSRLLLELTAAVTDRARVARGHCISYGNQIPNVPIVELARELCGVTVADEASAIEAAVADALGSHAEERDFLAALLGVPDAIARVARTDPATVRGRTTQGLAGLVRLASKRDPLVAAIEDLHWADASSLEFLMEISAVVPESRILLVSTFRPGSAPPWGSSTSAQRMLLLPLDADESERMVRGLPEGSDLSGRELDLVLEKGEGNPFFLEELARAVAQGSGTEVPGDVLDVLAARIDRLTPDAKGLLRTAAVIGREFDVDLLSTVMRANGELRLRLGALSALGFVEPVGAAKRYTFVHALTQEVTYGAMLAVPRQELHTSVAEALIDRYGDEPESRCEEIAHHLLSGTLPARALPYLELANAKAIRTHAMEEARGFFTSALELLEAEETTPENVARRVSLLVAQWPAFHFMHRHEEYAGIVERYVPIVDEFADPATRGAFLAQRGHRLWVFARYDESAPVLAEAFTLCEEAGDLANAAHAQAMMEWSDLCTGDYEGAVAHGEAVLKRLERVPIPILLTFVPVAISLANTYRGRWDEAAAWSRRAHDVGVEMGDDGMASFGSAFEALAELSRGDVETARALAEQALEQAPTVYFRGWPQAWLGAVMCRTGQARTGIEILDQVASFIRDSRHISGFFLVAPFVAEGWLLAGDHDRARAFAAELLRSATAAGFPFDAAAAQTALAYAALIEGEAADAAAQFRVAADGFATIGAENARAKALTGEGQALAALGDPEGARASLEDALATFERLGTVGEPDIVLAALGAL